MNILQAVLLGLLQGVTEFLPVSSSGHLVLARALMNINEIPVLFDVILHMATLVVVIWFFRRRVGGILAALYRFVVRRSTEKDQPNLVLALQLAGASVITAVIGLGISSLDIREEPGMVSLLLLFTAAILLVSLRSREGRSIENVGWGRALIMGTAQGLGVFPGISRSGITIGTGLFTGLDRKAAGEFSFLLSIPAIGGAFLLSLKDAAELSEAVPGVSLAVGFAAALAAGYASLKLLLWLIADGRLWIFAVYLIPVGIWGLIHFGF
jgi:undecaprenyl-diphosphatase